MEIINCHAHTVISDGSGTMLEMAVKAHELGHSALVITDHNYDHDRNFQTGWRERDVLEENELSPIPIILGAEIDTPFGDHLLFGKDVLRNWEHYKVHLKYIEKNMDLNLWVEVFKTYVLSKASLQGLPERWTRYKTTQMPYAMILCHPRDRVRYYEMVPKEWWELCHGFEIRNGLTDFGELSPDTIGFLRSSMPGAMELRNSDAHTAEQLTECWNETPHPIINEAQLCKWLRSGRKNWRLNHKPDLDKLILEEHARGIEFTQKMMQGMQPCPPEYLKVLNENMEDLLG